MPADTPSLVPDFRQTQKAFTDWLREPEQHPAPSGIEPRRLDIYRELFFNNVSGFIENAYPVLQGLLPAAEWDRLVEGFFARHRCHTPYFREISGEFPAYLEVHEAGWLQEQPWVRELVHFEWAEMAAEFSGSDELRPGTVPDGDLLDDIPVLAPALWALMYRWPVHTFSVENPPAAEPPAQPACLLLFRDAQDNVQKREVNPLTARLVERLQENPQQTGRALLQALAAEAGIGADAPFMAAGAGVLDELRQVGIIRGVLKA